MTNPITISYRGDVYRFWHSEDETLLKVEFYPASIVSRRLILEPPLDPKLQSIYESRLLAEPESGKAHVE